MGIYNIEAEPDSTGLADGDSFVVRDLSDLATEEVTAKQILTYVTGQTVAAGATLTLTAALHAGKTVLLDTAAGSVVTLPAATGTGNTYRFVIKTKATSNSHIIKVANGTDIMQGLVFTLSDDATAVPKAWAAGATDDTVTLNRTTTGSVTVGEWFEIQDIVSGVFAVRGFTQSSGTEATPFSATV
jgi:hypothetical protein